MLDADSKQEHFTVTPAVSIATSKELSKTLPQPLTAKFYCDITIPSTRKNQESPYYFKNSTNPEKSTHLNRKVQLTIRKNAGPISTSRTVQKYLQDLPQVKKIKPTFKINWEDDTYFYLQYIDHREKIKLILTSESQEIKLYIQRHRSRPRSTSIASKEENKLVTQLFLDDIHSVWLPSREE